MTRPPVDVRARLATVKDYLQRNKLFALPAERLDQMAGALRVSHFYCTDDTASSQPICGATKTGPDGGKDCPLCGLVFEEVEADERPCPFCGQPHWEELP